MQIISRAEAKALGWKRYFNGKQCPKGHTSERMVSSGGCIRCKKDRALNRERRPYELQFPDAYFQACYRRAIGGCKDEYIDYTNSNWRGKWRREGRIVYLRRPRPDLWKREKLIRLEKEAEDLIRIFKGLKRTAYGRFGRHSGRSGKDVGVVEETRRREVDARGGEDSHRNGTDGARHAQGRNRSGTPQRCKPASGRNYDVKARQDYQRSTLPMKAR